jgi:exodeoxyribonuclease V beta subunit
MNTFDVLSAHLDLDKSYFLESSAGTGKTFSIEHFVVRQIVEKGLKLERILIVTFTKKATCDLKIRLFENIQKIKREMEKGESTIEYVRHYQKHKDKKSYLKRLEQALLNFDLIHIFTIHSFCLDLLKKEHPEIELEHKGQERQLLHHFFYAGLSEGDFFPSQLHKLYRFYQYDEKKLFEALSAHEKEQDFSQLRNRKESLHQLKQACHAIFSNLDTEQLRKDILVLGEEYTKVLTKEKSLKIEDKKRLDHLCGWIENNEWDVQTIEQMAFEGIIFDLFKEKKQKGKEPKLFYPGLLNKVQTQLLPLLEYEEKPKWILYRLAASLRLFLDQNAKRKINTRFDDLILNMYAYIQDAEVKKSIQSLFDLVVIDEFQDTDRLQFDIFYDLFIKDQNIPIFLVGDPKQSIYGFRKADVYSFFKAKEAFSKEHIFELNTNFRSSYNLTKALNQFFSMAEDKSYLWLPKTNQTIPFSQVNSHQKETSKETALHFMYVDKKKESKSLLFEYIYHTMCQLIAQGFLFSDFAILVKDHSQQEAIVQFLESMRVSTQVQKEEVLKHLPLFWHLRALVYAILNPEQQEHLNAFLATPLCPSFFPSLSLILLEANNILFKEGWMQAIFYALWHTRAHTLIDLSPLVDLLQFLDAQKYNKSPYQLGYFLQAMEDHKMPIKTHEKGVVVTTIHKSKGLEYPIVFALGVYLRIKQQDRVQLWHSDERDAEKLRTLYVALTRAKQKVFVPLVVDKTASLQIGGGSLLETFFALVQSKKRGTSFLNALQSLDFEWLLQVLNTLEYTTVDKVGAVEISPQPEPKRKEALFDMPFEKKFFDLPILSFSSLYTPLETDEKKEQEVALPIGPQVGNYFHECLHLCFLTKVYQDPTDKKIEQCMLKVIPKSFFERYGPAFSICIKNALKNPLPIQGKKVHFFEIAYHNLSSETEFLFREAGKFYKGFIDLLFQFENKWYLVDWKSNVLKDDTLAAMQQEMDTHHYAMQAKLYAKAALLQNKPIEKAFYVFLRNKKEGVYSLSL